MLNEHKDEPPFHTESLISFEKVFKQQVKEQQQQHQQLHYQQQQQQHQQQQDTAKLSFNSCSQLPGTVDFRLKIARLTQEQAARRIQSAYRSYLSRRQAKHQHRYYQHRAAHSADSNSKLNSQAIQKHVADLKSKQGL